MKKKQEVLLTHGDSLDRLADNFKAIATSGPIVAGIANEKLNIYGVQFHPEVDLTSQGKKMMMNFLYDICGFTGNFTMDDRQEKCQEYIKKTVGKNKVLVSILMGNATMVIKVVHL